MADTPPADAPRDFDFAVGEWHVRHRRLTQRLAGSTQWVEFDGEMSTRKVLGGFGNVEDNRLELPEGAYRALALRTFEPRTGLWSIWWVDGRMPGRMDVPVTGQFDDAVGSFYADDVFEGKPIKVRFFWFATDPDKPRWEQAFSGDGGRSWETNWTMEFSRR